jgi:hypothetical protein
MSADPNQIVIHWGEETWAALVDHEPYPELPLCADVRGALTRAMRLRRPLAGRWLSLTSEQAHVLLEWLDNARHASSAAAAHCTTAWDSVREALRLILDAPRKAAMGTIEFEISDDDLNLVIDLLDNVHGERFYRPIWQALDAERDRRIEGAGQLPIRLGRDRATELSQWLADRAYIHATSADAGDNERATALARVAIVIEAALKRTSPHG